MVGDAPKRLVPSSKQELISRCQFSEVMIQHEWLPHSQVLDLGEDLYVHIYLDGIATGVGAFFQLKSRREWSGDFLKDGATLKHRFEVSDILHWEGFAQPCVLVFWNIALRAGRWQTVGAAIADLDHRRPQWRQQATATVRFPEACDFDRPGMKLLRQTIGHINYDLIAKGRPMEFKVSVPTDGSPEARAARAAWDEFRRTGKRLELVGSQIRSFTGSQWWDRWFGDEADPDKQMLVIENRGSDITMPATLRVTGRDRVCATIRQVQLKITQSGTDVIVLSNEDQLHPLKVRFAVPRQPNIKVGPSEIRLKGWGSDVCETRELMRFASALGSGGSLAVDLNLPDGQTTTFRMAMKDFSPLVTGGNLRLLDSLCSVQELSGIRLSLPNDGISPDDLRTLEHLMSAYVDGRVTESNHKVTLSMVGEGLHKLAQELGPDGSFQLRSHEAESEHELLGQRIDLGPVVTLVRGTLEEDRTLIGKIAESLVDGGTGAIHIADAVITYEYPDLIG